MNGAGMDASADEAEQFLIESIIKRHAELSEITNWIESIMVQRR